MILIMDMGATLTHTTHAFYYYVCDAEHIYIAYRRADVCETLCTMDVMFCFTANISLAYFMQPHLIAELLVIWQT